MGHDNIPCVEAMLAPDQTYVHRNASVVKTYIADEPVASPDGQYYIYQDYYNDLTEQSALGTSLFKAGETQRLTYGYRYGWNAEFLGWAHDSSGAYILYRPRSAMGDLTRSQYPIRKYLVPGAEARGLPTVISPAATPRWLPTPDVTPPTPTPTEETPSSSSSASPSVSWLLPLIGMGALGLLYYRPNWTKATGIGGVVLLLMALSITSCIAVGPSPNFDPEALDVQGGQLEIVIPAEHYISEAQVSPDGTWLYYTYQGDNGRSNIATSLLNIPENKLYDKPLAGWSGAPWLDDNHLSAESAIWRLSDMVVMPKVVVHIESIEEGKALLAGATQLFFVQGSSRYSIQSTDPDYPYTIRFRPTQLGCEDGYDFTPCAEAMLAPDQTYYIDGTARCP
ncbi:MAG: PD40 domain-containing protein [Chloroflexi bacterium]|nr:PD40 domain-containing protein [Chloroflexota bacterium]